MWDLLIFAGLLATTSAQAVTSLIVPSSTPLPGCYNSCQTTFGLGIQNATGFNETSRPAPSRRSWDKSSRRDISELLPRQASGALTMTLTGGVLKDQDNRTGYIASNYQFQFDHPPQAGAIYTAGWSVCDNGSIALGGQAIFWECPSGAFYNLYDRDWAPHCLPIDMIANGAGALYSTSPPAPESTGSNQNTIANGGGTQTMSLTSTSMASSMSSASSAAGSTSGSASSAASSVSSSASAVGSSASSMASSMSSSVTASISSLASSGKAAQPTGMPQQVIAWAAGIVGAIALV